MGNQTETLGVTIREARTLVHELFAPKPWIFWTDLVTTCAVAYGSFGVIDPAHLWTLRSGLLALVAVIAFYRAAMFTHEITHLAPGQLRGFRTAWNLLCGIPLLAPSFMEDMHYQHHARTYGTARDGEFVAFASASPARVVSHVLLSFLGLPAAAVRFLILAPLAWLVPACRRWVYERASSLVIDFEYRRAIPEGTAARSWVVQEVACFCFGLVVVVMIVTDRISPARLIEWYVIYTSALVLNAFRVLVVHRYQTVEAPVTFPKQIADSVNYPGSRLFGPVWAPLGGRFHAVHHLFPSLPYHALGMAHRRLCASLPNAAWHLRSARSLPSSLRDLLSSAAAYSRSTARRTDANDGGGARWWVFGEWLR